MKAIVCEKVLIGHEVVENQVVIFDQHILSIESKSEFESRPIEFIEKVEVHRYSGVLVPGFIDVHIHGASGHDVMDGTGEAIQKMSESIVKMGTTAFLATTMTMAQDRIERALNTVRNHQTHQAEQLKMGQQSGAKLIGAHLEGPFINPIFKGAQNLTYIQKPTRQWLDPHMDVIKMITLAPEMDEGFAFIRSMKDTGVVLSMGHTGCDYETACEVYEAGVHHVTHCFNAMTGLHHREPGVIGAILSKPFSLDIIADGIHVHPDFIGPFIKLKGIDKTVLITDAMRAAMMPPGNYDLGGQKVIVDDKRCCLEDGTLAGSILRLDQAIRNLLKHSDLTFVEVVRMLTENPAKLLGLFHERGSIAEGKVADFVLLNDDYQVSKVYVEGILNNLEA